MRLSTITLAILTVLLLSALPNESTAEEALSDEEPKPDNPRTVVAKWMDLVLADNIRDSWALTTKSRDLNAQHSLPRLKNKDQVRIERSLGNESIAVVVTNQVKHINTGKDLAFAFWLVRRDGSWLINMSYRSDPRDIEQQLLGLYIGGGVKWHVTRDDLFGKWEAGPGPVGGVGPTVCGSQFQMNEDGTFTLQSWGPGGPNDGTDIVRGTWRLEEGRIIRQQDKQRSVSRISWMASDVLVLQPTNKKSPDGKSGTHYQRNQPIKPLGNKPNDRPDSATTNPRAISFLESLAETTNRTDTNEDPHKWILQFDLKQITAVAKATQQDKELVSRVCRLVALGDQQRAAIVRLARDGKLGSLNVKIVEQFEKYGTAQRSNRAFNALVGLTPDERATLAVLMKRTGNRTVATWKLTQSGKLSMDEKAVVDKLKKTATAFFVNHESMQAVTKNDKFTPKESHAFKKLGEAIEQRFQQLYLEFFSC